MNDLLLRADALPGLLDGWGVKIGWNDEPIRYVRVNEHMADLYVDLALPEVRDRASRILWSEAWRHWPDVEDKIEIGSTAPDWSAYFVGVTMGQQVWQIGLVFFFCSCSDSDEKHGTNEIVVPGLADLDPSDPRLLPDGSRYVDAQAMKIVIEHVGKAS